MFTAKMYNPTTGNVSVVFQGKGYTVSTDHPAYEKLLQAYKSDDSSTFLDNWNVATMIKQRVDQTALSTNGVTVTEDGVFYDGEPVDQFVCDHILEMVRQGFDIQPMIKFLENLYQNPDNNSVNQLYKFLQHKNMPITEDGCFIGYKTVRSDFKDKYTGTIDNSVGQVVRFRRNTISNNPNNHCDQGLHVGALSYAGPGGWYNSSADKVVLVKVNPRDAVSVPNDHNFTKLRVCEYEVIGEYVAPLEAAVYTSSSRDYEKPSYYDSYNSYEDQDEDEDDFVDSELEDECDEDESDEDSDLDDRMDVVANLQKARKISSQGPSWKEVRSGQKLYLVFVDGSGVLDGVYFINKVSGEDLEVENELGHFLSVSSYEVEEMYYAY